MGGGGVDMRKIRVVRLRGVVWVELSPERVTYGLVSLRESGVVVLHSMWGGWFYLAERGSKAPGSKYLARSFEAGTKLTIKRENWDLLYKFFKKEGLRIGKDDFDPVINKEPGAAAAIVKTLWESFVVRRS